MLLQIMVNVFLVFLTKESFITIIWFLDFLETNKVEKPQVMNINLWYLSLFVLFVSIGYLLRSSNSFSKIR
jgi:hypothetical protein